MPIDRTQGTPLHHDCGSSLDLTFYKVIGAAGFAYVQAFKRFIPRNSVGEIVYVK